MEGLILNSRKVGKLAWNNGLWETNLKLSVEITIAGTKKRYLKEKGGTTKQDEELLSNITNNIKRCKVTLSYQNKVILCCFIFIFITF